MNNNGINLSVKIIHASAGTGKTHQLTNEFIKSVSENLAELIKRHIAITFSEKAACEMKTRIVHGVMKEISDRIDEETKIKYENQLFVLRVSTIHSFCRSLLKRFSFLFQIDPNFTVCDQEESYVYFLQSLSFFLEKFSPETKILKELEPMKLKKFIHYMEELRKTHPQVFLGIPGDNIFTKPLFVCFKEIEKLYTQIKKQNSVMDFNDLESLAYLLIAEHPEALNVLNDFDQAIDFIFVDEFQDTNLLQWKIIKELSKEWTSGRGAKAETGKRYGLFFVGDKKQSIYFFRGAENSVFDEAEKFFSPYLEKKFLTTNHRSFSEIIDFVNNVFEGKEGFPEEEKLKVSKNLSQKNCGFVEIKFFDKKNIPIREEKQQEYQWIAKRILSLIGEKFPVYDKLSQTFREIKFRDMAVLIRKRTHLDILENWFREYSIPFVNVGGIGFYQEPEIVFLISLLCVLADPSDSLSMENLKQSVFEIDEKKIEEWRQLLKYNFASSVIDRIVMELDMFSKLGSQGCANVEKFLMLVNEMKNMPFFQIVQTIRRISSRTEEPKADVFSEQQNAVRVLTVHASKGLEFPVVFLAAVEQGKPDTAKISLMHKKIEGDEGEYMFSFKTEKNEFYNDFVKKLEEEERRVLYVALTRARQALFITGAKQKSVWFDMLSKFEQIYQAKDFSFSETDSHSVFSQEKSEKLPVISKKPVSPVSFSSTKESFDFTGEKIGTIIHKIINEISNSLILPDFEKMKERAIFLLKKLKLEEEHEIEVHLKNLLQPEIRKVIEPTKNSFSELPFLAEIDGDCVYGVVDRVIIENNICNIYDYKTRKKSEILEQDIQQLKIYKNGIRQIFGDKKIKTFIVFTFCGIIKEV